MNFQITPEEQRLIAEFVAKVNAGRGSTYGTYGTYGGAIGGATTYSFTPTSLGTVFKVTHFDETLDLTDYASW